MPCAPTAPWRETAASLDARAITPGTAVGRYIIVDRVGHGSGGTVYAAYDPNLSRKVALKLIHRARSIAVEGDTAGWSAALREASALAQLDHPNVVTVYDVGDDGEQAYIAMELVDGIDLARWLEEESARRWRRSLRPFLAAGAGLAAAHARGIVHGDFKPANVLLGEDGKVRVSDFGVALLEDHAVDGLDTGSTSGEDLSTDRGTLWGTPVYMAPELFDGQRPTHASDVYSFCASVFEGLFGCPPAQGETHDRLHQAKLQVPTIPAGARVPRAVRDIVLAGLSAAPASRPPLGTILDRLQRSARPRLRRWLPAVAMVAAGGAGLAGWFGASRTDLCAGADRHLAAVWDDDRRDAVSEALLSTNILHATDTFAGVLRTLDDYGTDWVAAHERTCVATQRGEQSATLLDKKMACLQSRLSEYRALVDVLATADASVATRATSAVHELSAVATCEDIGPTQTNAWAPQPGQEASYARYTEHAGRARALNSAAKFDQGLQEARAAFAIAGELDATPLRDEARYLVGSLLEFSGDYDNAADALTDAALIAAKHGDDAMAARASLVMVRVLGGRLARIESAITWAQMADVFIQRGQLSPRAEVLRHIYLGEGYTTAGMLDDASDELDSARALASEQVPDDAELEGMALMVTANVEQRKGNGERGLALHQQSLALLERALGPAHPSVGAGLDNVGNALDEVGRSREAIDFHRRALDVLRQQNDGDSLHPVYQAALSNLSGSLAGAGKLEEAVATLREVARAHTRSGGPESLNTAVVYVNIAAMLGRLKRFDEAETYAAKAVPVLEATLGPQHVMVSQALTNLGLARLGAHRPGEALEPLRRAVDIQTGKELRAADRAEATFGLARAIGNTPEGRILATTAAALYRTANAQDDVERVEAFLASTPASTAAPPP